MNKWFNSCIYLTVVCNMVCQKVALYVDLYSAIMI